MLRQKIQKMSYALRLKLGKMRRKISAARLVVLSFATVILIGSLLLFLPFSQAPGAPPVAYIDAMFTAVSASCVTGLVTVTTATQWTTFGQMVILMMIQIGGLSFITLFTFVVVNAGKKINMKSRMTIQASLNQNNPHGMVRIVLLAIKGTFLLEAIGAILLFSFFWLEEGYSLGRAAYYGVFHSVSAFCNAGFDILGETSMQAYAAVPLVNMTIMLLIIFGGIGFVVWRDLTIKARYLFRKKRGSRIKLSLHTKLALITTAVLVIGGAAYFFATEYSNPATLGALTFGEKILASFFQAVTLRTAGFYTINQNALTESSKFVSSLMMMIGGSPGGTAGGVKTVTLAVLICSIIATLRGNGDIDVMKRRIPYRALQRAITVIGIMFALWFTVATVMEFTEIGSVFPYTFIDILFEVASALGTVGLTTGITPHLSGLGKSLIMLCMFIGRLGPISIAVSLQRRLRTSDDSIRLPEEDVLIG